MNVSDLMKWLAFYGNLYCGVCGRFRRGWVDWWTFQLADRSFPRKFHEGALTILTSDLQPVQESAHLVGDALNALQPEALLNGGYGYNACWNISGGSGRCIYKYINYKYIYIPLVGGIVVRHYHYLLTNCTFFEWEWMIDTWFTQQKKHWPFLVEYIECEGNKLILYPLYNYIYNLKNCGHIFSQTLLCFRWCISCMSQFQCYHDIGL